MGFNLLELTPHKVSRDLSGYITYVYGAPKTGKTTLATQMDGCLLLAFEQGYNALPGVIAQDIVTWGEMKQAFINEKDFDENEVYIFKAGNSSRSRYVEAIMKQEFAQNKHIQLVDQIADKKVENKRYAITPKTAVAIGQLDKNNTLPEADSNYFKYYVGFYNVGTGEFKICIDNSEKIDGNCEWKKFKKIKNDHMDIFYSPYIPEEKEKNRIRKVTIDVNGHKDEILWVRIKDETSIEYCMGAYDDANKIPEDIQVSEAFLK